MNCNETRENPEWDVTKLGLYSLALTVINILCIFLTGWFVLWIKAVTPERVPQYFGNFWRNGIPNDITSVSIKSDTDQVIVEEARAAFGIEGSETSQEKIFIKTTREKIENDEDYCRIKQLQSSTSNITTPTRSDSQIMWPVFETYKTGAKLSLIPEDIRRSSMSSEANTYKSAVSQLTSRPSTLSSRDTKLYYQAEVLINSSRDSLGSRQVPIDTMGSSETQMTNNQDKFTA